MTCAQNGQYVVENIITFSDAIATRALSAVRAEERNRPRRADVDTLGAGREKTRENDDTNDRGMTKADSNMRNRRPQMNGDFTFTCSTSCS